MIFEDPAFSWVSDDIDTIEGFERVLHELCHAELAMHSSRLGPAPGTTLSSFLRDSRTEWSAFEIATTAMVLRMSSVMLARNRDFEELAHGAVYSMCLNALKDSEYDYYRDRAGRKHMLAALRVAMCDVMVMAMAMRLLDILARELDIYWPIASGEGTDTVIWPRVSISVPDRMLNDPDGKDWRITRNKLPRQQWGPVR